MGAKPAVQREAGPVVSEKHAGEVDGKETVTRELQGSKVNLRSSQCPAPSLWCKPPRRPNKVESGCVGSLGRGQEEARNKLGEKAWKLRDCSRS